MLLKAVLFVGLSLAGLAYAHHAGEDPHPLAIDAAAVIEEPDQAEQWVTPETQRAPALLFSPCPLTQRNLPRFPEFDT